MAEPREILPLDEPGRMASGPARGAPGEGGGGVGSAPGRARLWRIRIGLLLFTALAGLVVVELGLRALGHRPSYLDADMFVPTGDRRTYALRPGYSGLYAGGRVHLGPHGLRGVATEEDLRPGALLLLGDSAGFGQGLDDDQTLGAELARLLSDRGHPTRVINAGVPGYNTVVELEELRLLLPVLRPARVVLLYVADNDTDPRPAVWRREDGSLDLHLSRSLTGRISRFLTIHLASYSLVRNLLPVAQEVLAGAPRAPLSVDEPGCRASLSALAEMQRLLAAEGIPFAVGGIGLVEHVDWLDTLESSCAARHIPYATLWRTRDPAAYRRQYAVSRTDAHAGRAATARMAAALADLLLAPSP